MMNYYKVAGHTFGVKLPDGDPLCSQLAQYEPFISPAVPDPIFVLSLADSLDDEGGELVYSGEPQSGEPIVRLFSTPGGWISEMAICPGRPLSAKLFMEKDFSAGKLLLLRPREALFSLNNALMLLYAFRTSGMHTLEMHASVIVNSGRAFLWLERHGQEHPQFPVAEECARQQAAERRQSHSPRNGRRARRGIRLPLERQDPLLQERTLSCRCVHPYPQGRP